MNNQYLISDKASRIGLIGKGKCSGNIQNVILHGDSGSGKSTTVKQLIKQISANREDLTEILVYDQFSEYESCLEDGKNITLIKQGTMIDFLKTVYDEIIVTSTSSKHFAFIEGGGQFQCEDMMDFIVLVRKLNFMNAQIFIILQDVDFMYCGCNSHEIEVYKLWIDNNFLKVECKRN